MFTKIPDFLNSQNVFGFWVWNPEFEEFEIRIFGKNHENFFKTSRRHGAEEFNHLRSVYINLNSV